VVEIELDVNGGSVEIRLPEGASASLDGVEASLGSAEDHRRGAPAAERHHFVLKGQIRRGSVEVRGGHATRCPGASEKPRLRVTPSLIGLLLQVSHSKSAGFAARWRLAQLHLSAAVSDEELNHAYRDGSRA
jgi:hypothetical protein